jgi:hypothetical protein
VHSLCPPVVLAAGLLACASLPLSRPDDVALDLYTAAWHHDAATGDRVAASGIFQVISGALPGRYTLKGCNPDIGGGVRCTFTPWGCPGDTPITMHLVQVANGTWRVTSAAVVGVFRSVDDPNLGTIVVLGVCGLRGKAYAEELTPFFTSEVYSSSLVPWPYADAPSARADSLLAMSRLDVNRGVVGDAVAALGQALALGEDTTALVSTAVVEAAMTIGLGIAAASEFKDRRGLWLRPLWSHGAKAYPTDTAILQRGVQFLDFAARLPRAAIDWGHVLRLGDRGLLNVRTASVAALDEMNGTAHYLLGRAYLDHAAQMPTCAIWTAARDALASGSTSLGRPPQLELTDPADRRLAASARQLMARADSGRLQACGTR